MEKADSKGGVRQEMRRREIMNQAVSSGQQGLPYRFDDENRCIRFSRHDLPAPWINYLSNGRLHAFVSQAGGGMCWWRSPQIYRITRYRFYNLPIDSPGFYIYLRMEDGTVWSPTFRPCDVRPDAWEAAHFPGYSVFTAQKDGLRAILTLFAAPDADVLVWKLNLENVSGQPLACDVFAYTELSQLVFDNEVKLGYYLKWNVSASYEEELEGIACLYTSWMQVDTKTSPLVYFAADKRPDSFNCNRDKFCGYYRDERNPAEVEQGKLSDTNLSGGEPCGALHHHVELAAGETAERNYFLGVAPGAIVDLAAAKETAAKTLAGLRAPGGVAGQFAKNAAWWEKQLGVLQCKIPDEAAARQVNIWNPVQSVVTARFSRSISSSASGIRGIGFRDSAQDMLAQAVRKPEWATEMLLYLASQQMPDGHAAHTCWPEEHRPAQDITRSDDHIWMTHLAYAIAAETGDLSFLDTEIPFLAPDLKSPAEESTTLWGHLLRGIEFTENHLGEHGLPLILFSDWNDHLGPFGRRGKGETTFVSEQHMIALRQLAEMAALRGEEAEAGRLTALREKQEKALMAVAWDGEWYLRGLDDDGQPIGSHSSDYAKIWVNAQSWMILAGCGEEEKNKQAMDSVGKMLDTGRGLQINAPGMPADKANSLPAGYSENGGIFCQANCWAIIAEALLGRGDVAWKYYTQLIPHNIIQKIGIDAYQSEAYAYSSTLLGPENEQFGQACVSQVTGTAAWMEVAVTQYILGVRPTLKGLLINPSIPADWDGFKVERKYRGCDLQITVSNPDHVEHGVKEVSLNGRKIEGNMITEDMLNGESTVSVKVIMGVAG